ncbi:putative DNA-binding protein [Acinetobacter phage Loki]|uniref:Putative DNA-binding protein n=1 Tax=Acinetobacter phage Loki TaxID=1970374 RepID=A0A0P1KUH8_9CAUD|nr:putative DNA-binding protein [Acinetobacter phage Loki]CUS06494.1 putative DNA-binding protein [Acinetobacter phage Loki]
MYDSIWANTVLEMLKEKPTYVSYEEIAERSGVGIGFINTFATGKVKSPSITRVEKLYNTLKEIKAEHIAKAQAWGVEINVTK